MSKRSIVLGEVYALRTGLWRKVEHRNFEGVLVLSLTGFTGNGAVFWFGLKGEGNLEMVSFDIAMEVFTSKPFPGRFSAINSFAMYKNGIAIISPTWNGNNGTLLIHLWVLEESTVPSGERWSWTKLYTSKPYPYTLIFPGIVWRNEIVFFGGLKYYEEFIEGEQENHESRIEGEQENELRIVLCNLSTNEVNMFAFPRGRHHFDMFDHVESLVLLNNNHI